MGIFQIRNTANGKVYLESSVNLDKIWNRHLTELRFNGHRNKALQNDWNAQGEQDFVFEVLAEIEPHDDPRLNTKELKDLMQLYLEELKPAYN